MNALMQQTDTVEIPLTTRPEVPELSRLMVHLLKGVIYRNEDELLWVILLRRQAQVREQAAVLLLELVLDEAEGHAFLKSRPEVDEAEGVPRMPRLIARRPLSYRVSLMLALLRKRLSEFDAGSGDTRLVLSREEIAELLQVFLPDGTNQVRIIDQLDGTISKLVELGFLSPLKAVSTSRQDKGKYEVRRILKAFVDAQWLAEFDTRLEGYKMAFAAEPAEVIEPAASLEGVSHAS